MKLEGESFKETDATPELIRAMVRDNARRGEYMIMMHDDDEEAFVQMAGDYDEAGCKDDGCFDLEYREGRDGCLYHCTRRVAAAEVESVFLDELGGRTAWRSRYEWERVDGYGPPTGFCTKCLIYWGKHKISGGHHYPERAPLRWTFGGDK